MPNSLSYDFESVNNIADISEPFMLSVDEPDPPLKPNEEENPTKEFDEFGDCDVDETDEFNEEERNSIGEPKEENKAILGISSKKCRSSLIPQVKCNEIKSKKNIDLSHL